jgi:hypothetical protein
MFDSLCRHCSQILSIVPFFLILDIVLHGCCELVIILLSVGAMRRLSPPAPTPQTVPPAMAVVVFVVVVIVITLHPSPLPSPCRQIPLLDLQQLCGSCGLFLIVVIVLPVRTMRRLLRAPPPRVVLSSAIVEILVNLTPPPPPLQIMTR